MGLVTDAYPDPFRGARVADLFKRLMYELRKEWRDDTALGGATGSEKLPVVKGALEGVHHLLRRHSDLLTGGGGDVVALAGFIMRGVALAHGDIGKRISMDVPVIAHKLLIRHAQLLAPYLTPHLRDLFESVMWNCHLKARKAVRKELAPAALAAVLRLTAANIAQGDAGAGASASSGGARDRAADFSWFLERISRMMTSKPALSVTMRAELSGRSGPQDGGPVLPDGVLYAPFTDLLSALQGYGMFAGPMRARLGQATLRDTALTLISRVSSFLDEDASGLQVSTAHTGAEFTGGMTRPATVNDAGGEEDEEDEVEGGEESLGPRSRPAYVSSARRRAIVMSTTLSAVASMVQQLDRGTLDDRFLGPLQELTERVILAFPSLDSGPDEGRADVCRAVLSVLVSLALTDATQALAAPGDDPEAGAPRTGLLDDFCARFVPAAFMRTLSRTTDWSGDRLADSVGGAALPAPVDDIAHKHPVTGLPESRLLFEYVPFWREVLTVADPGTLAYLRTFSLAAARRFGAGAAGNASAAIPRSQLRQDESDAFAAAMGRGVAAEDDEPGPPSATPADSREEFMRGASSGRVAGARRSRPSSPIAQSTDSESLLADALRRVRAAVYGSLMSSACDIIADSDLRLVKVEAVLTQTGRIAPTATLVEGESSVLALSSTTSSGGMADVQPADGWAFDRFLTLVDFFRYAVPLLPPGLAHRWAHTLVRASIRGAARYPHVSGFYTVLTVVMAVAQEHGWFEPSEDQAWAEGPLSSPSSLGASLVDVPPEARDTFELIDTFAGEVVARFAQYQGELLLSAAQFVLLLPHRMLRSHNDRVIAGLSTALTSGSTQPALASLGIAALSRLHTLLPEVVKPALPTLLPLLGTILEQGQQRSDADAALAGVSAGAVDDDEDDNGDGEAGADPAVGAGGEVTASAKLAEALRAEPKEARLDVILKAAVTAGAHVSGSGGGDDDGAAFDAVGTGASGRDSSLQLLYSAQLLAALSSAAARTDDDFSSLAAAPARRLFHRENGDDGGPAMVLGGLRPGPTPLAAIEGPARAIFASITLVDVEISSASLCTRVALLLGRLGGAARFVVGDVTAHLAEELAWGKQLARGDKLYVDMSTHGGKDLRVPLASILPRVVTLATTASTRQTKVAACELLHGILMVIVGRLFGGQQPPVRAGGSGEVALQKESDYYEVLQKLLPVALRLAVDAESVASQVFQPVGLQLAHLCAQFDGWPETALYVDAVCDGLTSRDAALRDYCALCFSEFAKYTIKHYAPHGGFRVGAHGGGPAPMESQLQASSLGNPSLEEDDIDGSGVSRTASRTRSRAGPRVPAPAKADALPDTVPRAIDALFRRVFAAARHPSPYPRLGAAMAWNACYRIVREDDGLTFRYIYAMTDHMLQALRASSHDASSSIGTTAAAAEALDHCERILTIKAAELTQFDALYASERPRQSPRTLRELVAWLFLRCALSETQARRKCMQLFDALAPRVMRQPAVGGPRLSALARGAGASSISTAAAPQELQLQMARTWVSDFAAAKVHTAATDGVGGLLAAEGDDGAPTAPLAATSASGTAMLLAAVQRGHGDATLLALAESCVTLGLSESEIPSPGTCTTLQLQEWTDRLGACLDIYTWLVKRGFLQPTALQPAGSAPVSSAPSKAARASHLLVWMRVYLDRFSELQPLAFSGRSSSAAPASTSLAGWVTDAHALTSATAAKLKRSRAILVCRLFTLVTTLLHSATADGGATTSAELQLLRSSGVLSPSLLHFAFQCIVAPASVAVEDEDMAAVSGSSGAGQFVAQAASRVMQVVVKAAGEAGAAEVIAAAASALREHTTCKQLTQLPSQLSRMSRYIVTGRGGASIGEVEGLLRVASTLQDSHLLQRLLAAEATFSHSADGGSESSQSDGEGGSGGRPSKRRRMAAAPSSAVPHSVSEDEALSTFAAGLGTAAYSLGDAASPEQLRLGAAFVDFASTLGWGWAATAGPLRGLADCLGVTGAPSSAVVSAARRFYNRFHTRIIRAMVQPAAFTAFGAGAASSANTSSASQPDPRVDLRSYPVMSALVQRLLATTAVTDGMAVASSLSVSGGSSAAASDGYHGDHAAARDFAWRLFTDLARAMARSSPGARARIETGLQAVGAGAAGADGPGEEAEVSADDSGALWSSGSAQSARIRPSVFFNALVAALPALAQWAQPGADDVRIQWLLFICRALAAFDDWVLVSAQQEPAGKPPSRSRMVPRLPPDAVAVVQQALERCANTVARSIDESPAALQLRRLDMQLQLLSMLPLLLPGYAADHRLQAQHVATAALWPGWPRTQPSGSFGRPAHSALSPLYSTALRLVRRIVEERFPSISSRELLLGDALAQFRRVVIQLFSVLAVTGSLQLLQLLHRALREGPSHVAYGDIVASLGALAARIAPSGPSPAAVLHEVLAACLVHAEPTGAAAVSLVVPRAQLTHTALGRTLCERLAVPLIQRLAKHDAKALLTGADAYGDLSNTARELAGVPADAPPPLAGWGITTGVMQTQAPPSLLHYLVNVIGDYNLAGLEADATRLHHVTTCAQLCAAFVDALPRDLFQKRGDHRPNPEMSQLFASLLPPAPPSSGKDTALALAHAIGFNGFLAMRCKDLVFAMDQGEATSHTSERLMLRHAAFSCLAAVLMASSQTDKNLTTFVFAGSRPMIDLLVSNDNRTLTLDPSTGRTSGGLPIFTDSTRYRTVGASLDRLSSAAPVPQPAATTRALRTATARPSQAGSLTSASLDASIAPGPLSQALNASQPIGAAYEHTGGYAAPAAARGAPLRGIAGARSLRSLMGEGDELSYSASQAVHALGDDEAGGTGAGAGGAGPASADAEASTESPVAVNPTTLAPTRNDQAQELVPSGQDLELDYFNSNPAMLPLLRMLDFAVAMRELVAVAGASKDAHKLEAGTDSGIPGAELCKDMPPWMFGIYARLVGWRFRYAKAKPEDGPHSAQAACPLPTRLFLIKLMINRAECFKPFARAFTLPVIRTLLELRDHAVKQVGAPGDTSCILVTSFGRSLVPAVFHYFLRDACEMICSYWLPAQPQPQAQPAQGAAAASPSPPRASLPFVPQTDDERAACSDFLAYLMVCAPSRMRYLRSLHISFLDVLIASWAPLPASVRPKGDTYANYLLYAKDETSRTALSADGARVAVGAAVVQALLRAGQMPFLSSVDSGGRISDEFFYKGILLGSKPGFGFSQKPLATYSLYAETVGLVLKTAWDHVQRDAADGGASASAGAGSGGSGSHDSWAGLLPALHRWTAEKLGKLYEEALIVTVDTAERGFQRFFTCASLVAKAYPFIVDERLAQSAMTAMIQARGRLYLRGRDLQLTLQLLHAGVRASTAEHRPAGAEVASLSTMWNLLRPHLPVLLKAQVSGRARGQSVQLLALQLVRVLLRHSQHPWTDALPLLDPSASHSLLRVFTRHPSLACRSELYDLLIELWDTLQTPGTTTAAGGRRGGAGASSASPSPSLEAAPAAAGPLLRTALLNGLFDADERIRLRIYEFWDSGKRLSSEPPVRLRQLLTAMFDPTPSGLRPWLHHAAPLLLSVGRTVERNESRTSIVNVELLGVGPDAPDQQDVRIVTEWGGAGAGSSTQRPLFSGGAGIGASQAAGFGGGGMIAATQSGERMYSLTQAVGGATGGRGGVAAGGLVSSFAPVVPAQTLLTVRRAGAGGGSVGSIGTYRDMPAATLGDAPAPGDAGSGSTQRASEAGIPATQAFALMRQGALSSLVQRAPGSTHHGSLAAAGPTRSGLAPPVSSSQLPAAAASVAPNRSHALFRTFRPERFTGSGGTLAAAGPARPSASQSVAGITAGGEPKDWAGKALARRETERAAAARSRVGRTRGVRMMRRYRLGELPDVHVPVAGLVRPLQTLCEVDASLAQDAFAALFGVVYGDVAKGERQAAGGGSQRSSALASSQRHHPHSAHLPDDEVLTPTTASALRTQLAVMIGAIEHAAGAAPPSGVSRGSLTSAVSLMQRLASLVSAADIETAMRSHAVLGVPPAFLAPPELLGRVSLSSMSYAGGIRLLEDGLVACHADSGLPASSQVGNLYLSPADMPLIPETAGVPIRGVTVLSIVSGLQFARASASAQDQRAAWVQLQDLYAAIGEEDVVGGLLQRTTASLPLRRAVLAELDGALDDENAILGKGHGAVELYSQALAEARETWSSVSIAAVAGGDAGASAAHASVANSGSGAQQTQAQTLGADDMYEEVDDEDDELMLAEERGTRARSSTSSGSAEHADGSMDLQEALKWDARRERCLAALQKWEPLRVAATSVVATGRPTLENMKEPLLDSKTPPTQPEMPPAVDAAEFRVLDPQRQALLLLSLTRRAQAADDVGATAVHRSLVSEVLKLSARGSRPSSAAASPMPSSDSDGSSAAAARGVAGIFATAQLRLCTAFASIMAGKLTAASAAVSDALGSLPALYASLSPLATEARSRSLLLLQPLVEAREFLRYATHKSRAITAGAGSALAKTSQASAVGMLPGLLRSWYDRSPSGLSSQAVDAMAVWDSVLASRRWYLREVLLHLDNVKTAAGTPLSGTDAGKECLELRNSLTRAMFTQASVEACDNSVRTLAQRFARASVTQEQEKASAGYARPISAAQLKSLVAVAVQSAEVRLEAARTAPTPQAADALRDRARGMIGSALGLARSHHSEFAEVMGRDIAALLKPAQLALQQKGVGIAEAIVALTSHVVADVQLLEGETYATYLRLCLDNDLPPDPEVDAGYLSDAVNSLEQGAAGRLSLPVAGVPDAHAPPIDELVEIVRTQSGGTISLRRVAAAKRATASLQLARVVSDLLQHCEEATDAGSASASSGGMQAVDRDETSSGGGDGGLTWLAVLQSDGVGFDRDRLAALAVTHVMAALQADTAAGASPTSSLASALAIDRLILARTAVLDDCGMSGDAHAAGDDGAASLDSAVMLLPRVLDLISTYPSALAAFAEAVRSPSAPLYAFLQWIPQLFALVQPRFIGTAAAPGATLTVSAAKARGRGGDPSDTSAPSSSSGGSGFTLGMGAAEAADVLTRLAQLYPQAVYYPFRISTAETPGETPLLSASDAAAQQQLLAPLRHALGLPLLSSFVSALEDLHSPEMKFHDWAKAARSMASAHRTRTGEKRAELPQDVQNALFDDMYYRCMGGDGRAGTMVHEWVLRWRTFVLGILNHGRPAPATRATVTFDAFAKLSAGEKRKIGGRDYKEAPSDQPYNYRLPSQLEELSAWLAAYNGADQPAGSAIEVPGQYDRYRGRTPPDPSSHVHIVSLDPRVLTMSSMRRPKRIVLMGHDERAYPFLAKGGEDIRVDQRTEQLFGVVNAALGSSAPARGRRLRVRTYAVVPVTPYIGLIEWVSNTAPIKSIIEKAGQARLGPKVAAGGGKGGFSLDNNDAYSERQAWVAAYGPQAPHAPETYIQMYTKASPTDAGRGWEAVMRHMDVRLLRGYLAATAPSAEGFHAVRSNFARSLAAFSMAGYLLGLGDRHLDNFLMDASSGEVVPIDFGALFGFATAALPVPELLAFRLTPQFLGVLSPLPSEALLKAHMVAALRAMGGSSAGRRALLTMLEVFALEPTVDWQATARSKSNTSRELAAGGKRRASGGVDDADDDDADGPDFVSGGAEVWYPRAKLLLAKMRLTGVSPSALMFLDLLQNGRYAMLMRAKSTPIAIERGAAPISGPDLARNMRSVVFGTRPVAGGRGPRGGEPCALRSQPQVNVPFALRRSEQRLLEATTGMPLTGAASRGHPAELDVVLTASPHTEAHVDVLVDMATDPNILMRQWTGLTTYW